MNKIIAIGGGEIGRPGFPVETTKIDKEIIKLSGKKKPSLLFIPTASADAELYFDVVKKHFGKRLGCEVDVLWLIREKSTKREIEKKILSSDIIYVGGGNTLKMLRVWKKYGVDKILEKAKNRGIVLSGLSAGSICWFKYGLSDSRKFRNPDAGLIKVSGLGFLPALHCPHFDKEKDREDELKQIMKRTTGVAIAMDNCAAIEFVDDTFRVISSKPNAYVYKTYWAKEIYYKIVIIEEKNFRPVSELFEKDC